MFLLAPFRHESRQYFYLFLSAIARHFDGSARYVAPATVASLLFCHVTTWQNTIGNSTKQIALSTETA